MAEHDQHAAARELLRHEFGPLICDALDDPDITDIEVTSRGQVFFGRHSTPDKTVPVGTMSAKAVETCLKAVAHSIGEEISRAHPIIEAELVMNGERFTGAMPPITPQPHMIIRKHSTVIITLDQYVERQIMTEEQAAVIRTAAEERKNILVAGGTQSGKTTFLNAILALETFHKYRLLIIEDNYELQCKAPNMERLRVRKPDIDMTRLLMLGMRENPDRIMCGEVRDRSALALINAWNTGHPGGLATVHADDERKALRRIESLIGEAVMNVDREAIADALNVIVFLKKTAAGRRVTGLLSVEGYDSDGYKLRPILG